MDDRDEKQIPLDLETPLKTAAEKAEPSGTDGESLEWVCHPARRNMTVTLAVSVFILVLVVVIYYVTFSVLFGILAFVILFGSLAGFYFPTRYRLSDDSIMVKTTTQTLRKKWSQYRTFYPDKNGILLSPFARPTRLENFRGMYIKFWNNRERVISFVAARIGSPDTDKKDNNDHVDS